MTTGETIGEPLVSVLTPSFNQGRFIGDCLQSVISQTYSPIEHIICDGGSTDGTLDVLGQAPATVRWLSEPDEGQSHALNKAFAMSRGEIIGWLNSDDAYLDPEAIRGAVTLFRLHPDVDVVYGHAALVNADGLILQLLWAPSFNYRWLRFENFICQPSAFIRRRALGEAIVDDSYDYAMDVELWLRLGRNHRFMRVDSVLAIDRHHPDRKVYTRSDLAYADEQRLMQTYHILSHRRFRPVRRAYRSAARLLGLRLLPAAFKPHACRTRPGSVAGLIFRQVLLRRRAMPMGAAPRVQPPRSSSELRGPQ